MNFIGRDLEAKALEKLYQYKESKLVVVYGRRRVGKSSLIEEFLKNKVALVFEGLEGVQTKGQLRQFVADLSKQLDDPVLARARLDNWSLVFDYLTAYFEKSKKKVVLFLDEFQWLAANQTKLVSIVKKYWDQSWKNQNIMLILCGSVSSYMVKKVIRSKALYGRANWELCLQQLALNEVRELLGDKRSLDELMQYVLIFGGIPKYLNEINTRQSLEQNINRLCFTENGMMSEEYHKIFYSQFKEYKTYETIVMFLQIQPRSLAEVAKKLKVESSGGVKSYLDNLEKALMVTCYVPFKSDITSKLKKYKLTDEYLRFYFKYIRPNQKLIASNRKRNLFTQLVKPVWQSWLGYAFENFCVKNAVLLSEKMGFSDYVLDFGPLFHRGDIGFQVDLVYLRTDKVITVCEIKYLERPVGINVVREVERKCSLIKLPRGYTLEKALISRYGIDEHLNELGYFDHVLTIEDLFG